MSQQDNDFWLTKFNEIGAIALGHFVLQAGGHSDRYFDKDGIFPHAGLMRKIAVEIALQFAGMGIETVAAPVVGAVALCHLVVDCLAKRTQAEVIYPWATFARKSEDGKSFKFCSSHEQYIRGKRVLIVEDILTTGGSVGKVITATRALGGDVVGVGAICNRGGVTAEMLDIPRLFAVATAKDAKTWSEEGCPLCQDKVPVSTDLGHGQAYLARKAAELAGHSGDSR
ncbi:MAG: phosphoribosyltransferase family protein [Candidatus Methylomirabilota bacterium]